MEEAGAIAYSNVFEFGATISDLRTFLDRIGNMRKFIKHIALSSPYSWVKNKGKSSFELLKDAHGLLSLQIHMRNINQERNREDYQVSVQTLIKNIKKPMRKLHLRRMTKKFGLKSSILDVVSFTRPLCISCQNGEDCKGSVLNSRMKCKDALEQCKALSKEVRSLLAEDLEIEEY